MDEAIEKMEKLGKEGFIISIAYGHCGNLGILYTVDVMSLSGEMFEKPIAANTFPQCIEIAEIEINKRGWLAN